MAKGKGKGKPKGGDKFYPDAKEPHVHEHKGGATFTAVGHNHKALQSGETVYRANCNAVCDELKDGNDRDKKIVTYIRKYYH